ncbi:MAG TPA: hypothetical protein VF857_10600 [Spirochaetota bacterium]
MIKLIRGLFNREVIYSALNQIWRMVYGPVVLLFIPLFLSAEHQGFWFTFMSISALSVFADLGFNNIIMQFSAHESAFVEYHNGIFTGTKENIERLSSLFQFVNRWIITVSTVSFPVIFIIGFIIFIQKESVSYWLAPWIIYLAGSALNFVSNSILSFFEGCHKLAEVQKIRFFSGVTLSILVLSFLYFRFDLYALALSMFANSIFIFSMILVYFGSHISALRKITVTKTHDWKKEILRLFWKYAISWGSGYLIFQIYTPLMFQAFGSVLAGKVGITIALWTTAFNISNIWMYTATPKINMCVAKRNWKQMDRLFMKNISLSTATYLIGVGVLLSAIIILPHHFMIIGNIINRFLPVIPFICIGAGWFLQILVNGMAVYLRSHKEEPLMIMSVLSGIYIVLTTVLASRFLPSDYFFSGFLSSYAWGLPVIVMIFKNKREKWHFS